MDFARLRHAADLSSPCSRSDSTEVTVGGCRIRLYGIKARRRWRRARPVALATWTASIAARPATAPLTPADQRGAAHEPATAAPPPAAHRATGQLPRPRSSNTGPPVPRALTRRSAMASPPLTPTIRRYETACTREAGRCRQHKIRPSPGRERPGTSENRRELTKDVERGQRAFSVIIGTSARTGRKIMASSRGRSRSSS